LKVMTLKRKRGKGERRKKGWHKENDDWSHSGQKEKREVKRRKKNKEEEMLEASFPILEGGNVVAIKQSLMHRMEYVLSSIKSSAKYGPRSKENADFSACIGFTSNTIGLNGFRTPHNL